MANQSEWEIVHENQHNRTDRLRVSGGYLYRARNLGKSPALAFVPDPPDGGGPDVDARIRSAARVLVARYIANRGTRHEFVKCITPEHASEMTPEKRYSDPTWAAWDSLRHALGEGIPFVDYDPEA